MQIEPARQQRLYEHLNNLFLNDINDYERTVGDVTFACDMARDYCGTVLLCGWQGDYGDSAVHLGTKKALTIQDGSHPTRTEAYI